MEEWRKNLYRNYSTNKGRVEQFRKEDCSFFKDKIKKLLPKDKSVSIIDLAAGHGTLLQCLKKSGYKNLKGIDLSKEEVNIGNELGITELFEDNIFHFLENTEETYDVIFLIDVLEH